MKQVFQNYRSGELAVLDVPPPACSEKGILVSNAFSLISPGTEKTTVHVGQKSLIGKARARPDLVKKTVRNFRTEGLKPTIEKVRAKLDALKPLGYSSAGVVVEAGPDSGDCSVGDRVACGGGGYANHAEVVFIPRNLVVPVPDNVSLEHAAFATIGAIALHGIRQSHLVIGESVCIVGLGLVGQLGVQIAKAAGCSVLAIDTEPSRCRVALDCGADFACDPSQADTIGRRMTRGLGVDAVILAAATPSSDPVNLAGEILRDRGRVIVLGAVGMDVDREQYYQKELDIRLARSYGPGRYDPNYEEKGHDYPPGFVRWTEQRNMQAFLDLLSRERMDLDQLITHRIKIEDATSAYELITGGTEESLGVLIEYKDPKLSETRLAVHSSVSAPRVTDGELSVGFLGAGSFAQSYLLPHLKAHQGVRLSCVVTATGGNARTVAEKFGFESCSTNPDDVIGDEAIGAVIIATRHNLHASFTEQALAAGKTVLVEKPLALNRDELSKVADSVGEGQGALMVGFNRRFSPLGQEAKRLVENRGPISITYRISAGPIPSDHWIKDEEVGGGRILGEVCHFLDLMQFFTGSTPTRVFAQKLRGADPEGEDEDTIHATVAFSDGSVGSIAYLTNGDPLLPKERIEVFGEGLTLVIDDFRTGNVLEKGKRRKLKARPGKGHREELEAFVACAVEGLPLPISFEELAQTTTLTFDIRESLRTGLPVESGTLS